MKQFTTKAVLALALIWGALAQAQDEPQTSNIQKFTPSKLMDKGQWDIKWFNNLYTETESTFTDGKEPRRTFFTSTLEGYTGVGNNKRWNVGLILEFRSNVIADRGALEVFRFDGEEGTARSGFTSFAPSVKFVPFKNVGNFSVQTAFHIPLVDHEIENGVFLDQKGYIWQNRFFYDYTFAGNKWQLFSELNTEFNFGKDAVDEGEGETLTRVEGSFANNSLNLVPGLFLSYFPSSDFTVLVSTQYLQRIDLGNDFSQSYLALGGGVKYQLTDALNIEALYTNFVTGSDTGLGQTFNIGLRAIL